MSRKEYEALPDRQTYEGVPGPQQEFRDSAHPDTVFWCASGDHGHYPLWWAFGLDTRE